MGHSWVERPHLEREYDALAGRLLGAGMTDVFVHVGPLAADGTLPPARYPEADSFLAALERRLPKLRVQAWIGQREARGGGPLDLDDPLARGRIVSAAEEVLGPGVRKGLGDLTPQQRARVGIALYAEWTTTHPEWSTHRQEWLMPR